MSNRPGRHRLAVCLGRAALSAGNAHATDRLVDSLAALQTQIRAAAPGDAILLKDGIYQADAALAVTRAGTADQPITIAAETVGGAEIGGGHGFVVSQPAAFVVIRGFKFTHAAGRATMGRGTSHARFTRNTFRCTGVGAYLKSTVDMDGQPRPHKKSIGADEPDPAPVIARLLTPAEVGPAAK